MGFIRIKDNSVRFRLTQSEVAELGKSGVISSFTEFIDRPFIYTIERTDDTELSASFIENKIVANANIFAINDANITSR